MALGERMKKKYFFIFLVLLVAGKAFSFQKGFISVDKAEVRNFPASNSGKVIKTLKEEAEIIIYDTKGTNKIENGIIDTWYKISDTSEQYLNISDAITFPSIIYKWNVYDQKFEEICIYDYKIENNQLYLKIISESSRKFHWISGDEINWKCNNNKNILILEKFLNNEFDRTFFRLNATTTKARNNTRKQVDYTYVNKGINAVFEESGVAGDWLYSVEISENTIDLPLGLEIGLSKETVIKILGVPPKEENDSLFYEIKNTYTKLLEFDFLFEDNQLTKITFRQEF